MLRRALLAFLLLLSAAPLAPAQERSIVLESFDVEINVSAEGDVFVTETLRPRFTGSWNGLIRLIPIEYRYKGFNYTLLLDPINVTDERGNELRYEIGREGHLREFKIWVPGARNATRTIVLRYRVRNGLRFFDDHDELYWNVTGDEWEMPIEFASATVSLPAGVRGLRAIAYTGAYGSTEQEAGVELRENSVRVQTRRPLGIREGLTVVVGWDKGAVKEPGIVQRVSLFLRSNWPLSLPIVVFGLMFWLWYTRGRDPRLRPVAAQYEPPQGLTPAEVGTLIDNSADMRDITATLVDLAVRGYLFIDEKKEEKLLGLWSGTEYAFELRKPMNEWQELKPHERTLLSSLFYSADSAAMKMASKIGPESQKVLPRVELSELENTFYRKLPGIREAIFTQLMQRGYYDRRPDAVKKGYLIAAAVLAGVSIWGGGAVAAALGQSPLTFIVAGLLSAGIVAIFGWQMPARTLRGAQALEGVLGFEEFLSRVESDRFERMVKTPKMFEMFLPFAMALGVERNWVRAFEDIYKQPPEWYRGGRFDTGFRPSYFVNNLSSMSSRAGTMMASAPRSSGGSGFGGGGGFSGGGFGGGGGRGF